MAALIILISYLVFFSTAAQARILLQENKISMVTDNDKHVPRRPPPPAPGAAEHPSQLSSVVFLCDLDLSECSQFIKSNAEYGRVNPKKPTSPSADHGPGQLSTETKPDSDFTKPKPPGRHHAPPGNRPIHQVTSVIPCSTSDGSDCIDSVYTKTHPQTAPFQMVAEVTKYGRRDPPKPPPPTADGTKHHATHVFLCTTLDGSKCIGSVYTKTLPTPPLSHLVAEVTGYGKGPSGKIPPTPERAPPHRQEILSKSAYINNLLKSFI